MNWYIESIKKLAFRNKVLAFSKRISTVLANDIINKFENKELNYGQIIIDQNQEDELRDFDIRKIAIEIRELSDGKNALKIDGNFNEIWRDVFVIIGIDTTHFGKDDYEFFATELRRAIGHEIEHAENTSKNPSISASYDSEVPKTLIEGIYMNKRYLLNESEINAYIKEFMLKAKYTGETLEVLLKEFIQNQILKCNPIEITRHINQQTELGVEVDKIIQEINDIYQNRINQIYPNRKDYIK